MDPRKDVVRSRSHPLFRRLWRLKHRGDRDLALLEGVKLLEEAAAAGLEVLEAAVSPDAWNQARCRRAVESVAQRGTAVRSMAAGLVASLSEVETSQGVLALARRPAWDEASLYRRTPLLIVAVGLQNPGNLGGLLRTAEAAGATGAYLTRGCADPFSWKALRGSMGSAFRLPVVTGLDAADVVRRLHARGIRTFAAASEGGALYDRLDLRGPTAFALGSEGTGLPAEIASAAERVRIPMEAPVESLNVGVAAGLLLFEAARQRRAQR